MLESHCVNQKLIRITLKSVFYKLYQVSRSRNKTEKQQKTLKANFENKGRKKCYLYQVKLATKSKKKSNKRKNREIFNIHIKG